MTELTMFGYRARLVLDLPDGPHDVTGCVELVGITEAMAKDHATRTGFWVNTLKLIDEIEVEKRTRLRTDGRSSDAAPGCDDN